MKDAIEKYLDLKGLGNGNLGRRLAILYIVVRENLSSREVWLEKEWDNEVREEEKAQNTQSLVNHNKDYGDSLWRIW